MKVARALAAGAVATVLAACVALPTGERLPAAEAFDVLGRVQVRYNGRAFTSNFRWRHGVADDDIWLMSPIGQTLAYISADGRRATLISADQQTYADGSVAALTQRALGWALPLEQLQHWLGGAPVPGMAVGDVARDALGRLARLEQDGWRIQYTAHAADPQHWPWRLDLAQGAQKIRLVIDTRRTAGR